MCVIWRNSVSRKRLNILFLISPDDLVFFTAKQEKLFDEPILRILLPAAKTGFAHDVIYVEAPPFMWRKKHPRVDIFLLLWFYIYHFSTGKNTCSMSKNCYDLRVYSEFCDLLYGGDEEFLSPGGVKRLARPAA
jgi:hypothetical protein